MPAFQELNWGNPDVWGIVVGRGIATVELDHEQACDTWLADHGYARVELNFRGGISPVVSWLGEYFQWEAQFGYTLDPASRNLNALRDGFEVSEANLVMKLQKFELAWAEDQSWSRGFLSVISEYSLRHLALGRRFFALLPVADSCSMLVGQSVEELVVPFPFRFRGAAA